MVDDYKENEKENERNEKENENNEKENERNNAYGSMYKNDALIDKEDMFFGSQQAMSNRMSSKMGSESEDSEISGKGINKKFEGKYDIKMTIGSITFVNIIEMINQIGYDVIMIFRKKGVRLYIFDISGVSVIHVWIDKTEIADYVLEGVEEDDEKVIYFDTSIVNELMISEDYPLDIYVDTIHEKRIYFICAKDDVSKRLISMAGENTPTSSRYKEAEKKLSVYLKGDNIQKVVVSYNALKRVIASLSRKLGKKSGSAVYLNVELYKNKIRFSIDDETRSTGTELSGEDLLVYPLDEYQFGLDARYFIKFGKLKLSYQCSMYMGRDSPFMFETRLGAGKIIVWYGLGQRTNIESGE